MTGFSFRTVFDGSVLGPIGALGMTVFILLLAQDSVNSIPLATSHFAGLTVALIIAVSGGYAGRRRAPWFGWISYGTMVPSAVIAIGLGLPFLLFGALTNGTAVPLYVSLVLLGVSLPAALVARRRVRSTIARVQSNNRIERTHEA